MRAPLRTPLRALLVLAALAALLAVPTAASAYAPDTDEFVNCIRTTDRNIECVVELLHSDCLTEVVSPRAKEAVMAAAQRQADRPDNGPRNGNGPGNGNGPPGDYQFHLSAKPKPGDIAVTIECGPERVRGVLVASETSTPLAPASTPRGAVVALTGLAGLALALGAVELVANRRRRHG